MTSRQSSFGVSGHPLAQLLAMIVMGVVLVAAVVMGAFVLMLLLGLFVVGYVAFWIRAWWRSRRSGGRGPFGRGRGPAKGIRYIEGEYEVIEAEADAERRRSGDR